MQFTDHPSTVALEAILNNAVTRHEYRLRCENSSIESQVQYIVSHSDFPAVFADATRKIWGEGCTPDMSVHMATLCHRLGDRTAKVYLVISDDITQMHALTLWEPEQALTSIYLPSALIERCMVMKGGLTDEAPESAYDFSEA